MKEIPLTKGYVALVDDDDYDELIKYHWRVRVFKHTSYATRVMRINGVQRTISMHRQILGILDTPELRADHIDFNGLNNQKSNLRTCTHQQNNKYKQSAKKSRSKYLGVAPISKLHNKRYRATIYHNYKQYHLGYYATEEEAALAYNEAAKKFHGEFANLNKVA